MSKGDDTRELILEHALASTSRVGLEALSLGELVKGVGLSKSGLFSYFGSKEELQLAVIDRARTLFTQRVVAPALHQPRGEPRVRALHENWLAWDRSPSLPGGCVFATWSLELDDRPGVLRDALVAVLREWLGALHRACRIAIEEGHFRAGLDVDQFVFEGYGAVLAYNHYKRMLGDERAAARVRRAFDELFARARA